MNTIRLPACWKRLAGLDFETKDDRLVVRGTDHPVLSEKDDHTGIADPKPHYDDDRVAQATLDDGSTLTVGLCSGQDNYYASVNRDMDGVLWDYEILDDLGDSIVIANTEIIIEWDGTDA